MVSAHCARPQVNRGHAYDAACSPLDLLPSNACLPKRPFARLQSPSDLAVSNERPCTLAVFTGPSFPKHCDRRRIARERLKVTAKGRGFWAKQDFMQDVQGENMGRREEFGPRAE